MLVTALEANTEVPKMELVAERLLQLKGREEANASNEKVMAAGHRYRKIGPKYHTTVETMATSRGTAGVLLSRRVKLTRVPSRKLTQQELNERTAALTVRVWDWLCSMRC